MTFYVLGMSHHSAPLALRERCYIKTHQLSSALSALCQSPVVHEAAILSTCNRTEIYAIADSEVPLIHWFAQHVGVDEPTFMKHSYLHKDQSAMTHGMRVGAGLDSMLLGEPQIFGQIKKAYAIADEGGYIKTHLHSIFSLMFSSSKKVRHETQISRCPLSLAHGLMKKAQEWLKEAQSARVLLIGAGEMVQIVATYLSQMTSQTLLIANRDVSKAQALAEKFSARAMALGEIEKHLSTCDMVVAATNSESFIIDQKIFKPTDRRRFLLADLSMPRNIDPALAEHPSVMLCHLDELTESANAHFAKRQEAAVEAEKMIDSLSRRYIASDARQQAVDLVRDYREQVERVSEALLSESAKTVDAATQALLQQFAHKLCQRIMHEPTTRLKEAVYSQDQAALSSWQLLFAQKETQEC